MRPVDVIGIRRLQLQCRVAFIHSLLTQNSFQCFRPGRRASGVGSAPRISATNQRSALTTSRRTEVTRREPGQARASLRVTFATSDSHRNSTCVITWRQCTAWAKRQRRSRVTFARESLVTSQILSDTLRKCMAVLFSKMVAMSTCTCKTLRGYTVACGT